MIHSLTTAVVTSRLRRLVRPDDSWLAGMRAVLRRIASEGTKLIIGQGTAGSEFVRRASATLNIPFEMTAAVDKAHENEGDLPLRDRLVLDAADIVYVLGLRNNGNLHRLLRERLQNSNAAIVLVDLPELQAEASRRELLKLGATTWQPESSQCRPFEPHAALAHEVSGGGFTQQHVYEIVPFPPGEDWELLTHTTRSCAGPWPDESFETYADSLFESRPEADHSSLGTLKRIVAQRRLIASAQANRGGHPVVSFTACPLKDLLSLHRFRPHRVRWDFEPYGLCIRRDWLRSRGARPVIYGDDACWQSLSEEDRPFFQIEIGATVVDWSVEREWRRQGDLDLTELGADDALLFVPDFEAAKSVARLSPWPVTLSQAPDIPVV